MSLLINEWYDFWLTVGQFNQNVANRKLFKLNIHKYKHVPRIIPTLVNLPKEYTYIFIHGIIKSF